MYKDILLHVDTSRAVSARIDAAIRLARDHEAHLVGLGVLPTFTVPVYAEAPISEDLLEEVRNAERVRVAESKKAFEQAVDGSGLSWEWREAEGDVGSALIERARYSDVVVMGQSDPEDPADIGAGIPDRVVLESGRPGLVIPYGWRSEPFGRRVLVAWNGSRESVRAVCDSLPILKRAVNVEVLTVRSRRDASAYEDVPTADITLHLARHGVTAEANAVAKNEIDVGNRLLSKVSDDGIDLLVTGAYGHSRFRELVLGGVTRFLLEHMTVPVFLSH